MTSGSVMQELKGAAWATIAAFARRAEFAPSLWERLLQVRHFPLRDLSSKSCFLSPPEQYHERTSV